MGTNALVLMSPPALQNRNDVETHQRCLPDPRGPPEEDISQIESRKALRKDIIYYVCGRNTPDRVRATMTRYEKHVSFI